MRHWWRCLIAVAFIGLGAGAPDAVAQRWGGWRGARPRFPDPDATPDRLFTFGRVMYQRVTQEWLGQGWRTDYPEGDINFMWRLGELTSTGVSETENGQPNHVVLRMTPEMLFDYPFIFMSDVGTIGFEEAEVEALREYLLRGGFLWVDDFWGEAAWDRWAREIGRVLPEYPIFDIPMDHPILQVLYRVEKIPQIPSIQFWRRSGGYSTSERGAESAEPHFRGIADESGRLMVVMTHNTDIADGWEREGEEYEFFYRFSSDAYALGINIVLYAMTH